MNWVGCKILSLFPVTRYSIKQKINTTYLLLNVSVLNLGSRQTPIFDLQKATIMVLEVFSNISPTPGYFKTPYKYPSKTAKFEDEGGRASDGNLVPYIENTEARNQYEYFLCPVSHGLTSAGLSRINQSIESFCFAILGLQVNVRSSITGSQGSSIETLREFLSLVEDAIRNPDISKSVQRFQLAIESAKVRLDLAISPGTWLLPSKMVVNTESVVGYNNKLKKATSFMKIGVNSDLNIPVKRFCSETQFWVWRR